MWFWDGKNITNKEEKIMFEEDKSDYEKLVATIQDSELTTEEKLELVKNILPDAVLEYDRDDIGDSQVVIYTGIFQDEFIGEDQNER